MHERKKAAEMGSKDAYDSFEMQGGYDKNNLLRRRAPIAQFARSPPPKTTCAALIFLIMGIAFTTSGASIYFGPAHDTSRGLPIFILGLISKYSY
jgi:hypothetical protein